MVGKPAHLKSSVIGAHAPLATAKPVGAEVSNYTLLFMHKYYWPRLSNPGQYSVAFHFRDWGRDLDMQTDDFRVTLRDSFSSHLPVM